MPGYNYRKPRRLNWVSILLGLVVAAAIYGGVQFGPPYYRAWKVDTRLSDVAMRASDLQTARDPVKEEELLLREAREAIQELGVTDEYLLVEFDPEYAHLRAAYAEEVTHPLVGKKTVLRFERTATVPGDRKGVRSSD